MNKFEPGLIRFIQLCQKTKDEATLIAIFELFFTPEEQIDLANRYNIIQALIQNEQTQREIAKNLTVSIAKITRGSNELKRVDQKLLTYLTKNLG
jgi:TrpR family trp operon transcriptional repressor